MENEELSELLARERIRNLVNRYCVAADHGRLDEVVALFTPDATYDFGQRSYSGAEGIREMFAESGRRAIEAGFTSRIQHSVTTSAVDIDDDTAVATTYVSVLAAEGVDHWGKYTDAFVRIDDDWLISQRKFTLVGAISNGIGEVLR